MSVLYIGNKLSKHGYSVTNIETLGKQLVGLGYDVYFASEYKNKILRLLDMLSSILRLRRKLAVVLIDVYSKQGFYFALFSAWVCRMINVKYIPILHGGNLPLRLKKHPALCKSIFAKSEINVAPSRYLEDVFSKEGFNVRFIPNNIETTKYEFKERPLFHPTVLWVRSFHKIYNPLMAVDVLIGLLAHFPDAKLCMVGPDKDGSMQKCKDYIIEKNVGEHIKITGKLSKEEWHKLSRDYDVFINTTHVDNTPVSIVEAMALGLPIVSTGVGGIPFLVQHEKEGMLVPDNDVPGMVSSIKSIVNNPAMGNKLATNARKKAESFDWETVKEKWNDLLQKL